MLWLFLIILVAWAWAKYDSATLNTIVSILSGFLALVPLVLRQKPPIGFQIAAKDAAALLMHEVKERIDKAARRRGIATEQEMPVRWHIKGILSPPPRAAADLPGSGDVTQLVDIFATQPHRLVVVGDAGSGKTSFCLLLARKLAQDDLRRVPIWLPISSWNPQQEPLDEWIRRRILKDHFFVDDSAYKDKVVEDLYRRLLPILDGLDEMSEAHQSIALRKIDDYLAGRSFVLTCRTQKFDQANAECALRNAVVVQLLPLDVQDVAKYLRVAASSDERNRWEPVLTCLKERPDSPLAATLTNPLMLFLTQVVYKDDSRKLARLPDEAAYGDVRSIKEHLLDVFVPRVFEVGRPRPRRSLSDSASPPNWTPAQAQRWLEFLAGYLSRRKDSENLAWWKLHKEVPGPVFALAGALVGGAACCLLGWLMFGLFGDPVSGLLAGLAVGAGGGLVFGWIPQEAPRRFASRVLRGSDLSGDQLIRDLGFGVVGALVGGRIAGVIYGPAYGIAVGAVFGLAFGAVRRFTEPTEPRKEVTPGGTLKSDQKAILSGGLLGGLVGALVGGSLGGLGVAAARGFIFNLDNAFLEGMLGAAVGLVMGAGGLGLLTHATSAWGRFVTTRVWLALRRKTPLRLMKFLEYARELDVLRQAGPYYQFRHPLLRDRLAHPVTAADRSQSVTATDDSSA